MEDFVCEHCGARVKGDGYTNHCPHCLWSKHVDVNPGDRAAFCGGLMEPTSIVGSSPNYSIIHRCLRCRVERKNKIQAGDSVEILLAIAKKP